MLVLGEEYKPELDGISGTCNTWQEQGGDGKGGLAVNRTVLENILKAPCHANWMMSILPF